MYSDSELIAMFQQYTLTRDGQYISHLAAAVMREQGNWRKCHECGNVYRITEKWDDGSMCSNECLAAYCVYIDELLAS
jgi:hypothetical protein